MAATRRAARRALRRSRIARVGRELPWLAASLGALASRDAFGQSFIDGRFLLYKESDGRTQVLNPMVQVHQDLGESFGQVNLLLAYDSISGASPTGGYPTADVTTSASGKVNSSGSFPMADYTDNRKSVSLSYGRKFGAHLPTVDVSYAKENDYTARGFGATDSWIMAQGRGTLHFGVAISRDIVAPVTTTLTYPKSQNGFSLGWTWIFGERDSGDLSASLMDLSGYLNDPYKVVPIGTPTSNTTLPDTRPDHRSRVAIVAKYAHYYLWGGALKAAFRYYGDDWSIRSATLDLAYDQHVGSDWVVSPAIRLYTQSAASFYGNIFAAPQPYMSADYRLSSLYSALAGLGVSHKLFGSFGVNAGATIQSQKGRDRVTVVTTTPGERGASSVSSADMTVIAVTVGFTYTY